MKKRSNFRMIVTTLASAAVASVLVLGVAQAGERQGQGYGHGSAMGQQGPRPGPHGQGPYGSGMGIEQEVQQALTEPERTAAGAIERAGQALLRQCAKRRIAAPGCFWVSRQQSWSAAASR